MWLSFVDENPNGPILLVSNVGNVGNVGKAFSNAFFPFNNWVNSMPVECTVLSPYKLSKCST